MCTVDLPESSISKIDIAAHRVIDRAPIEGQALGIALSPDGTVAYIAGGNTTNEVEMIDTATLQPVGKPVEVGFQPEAIAAVPAKSPKASFAAPTGLLGAPTQFAASPLPSPTAVYQWSFGDGASATGATVSHTYTSPGEFPVTLTVGDQGVLGHPDLHRPDRLLRGLRSRRDDADGHGSGATGHVGGAVLSAHGAGRLSCQGHEEGVSLQAARRRRQGKGAVGESAVARATVPRGKSKLVSLEPRPRFAAKLAVARHILIRESRSIGRETRIETRWLTIIR